MSNQAPQNPIDPQTVQAASVSSAYTQETDRLLKKYLKLATAQIYWSIISRIIIIVLIVSSLIFSTMTLAPFMMEQLETIQGMQSSFTSLPTSSSDSGNVSDIIDQLSPEQREAAQNLFK
jgi:hypothetical protein